MKKRVLVSLAIFSLICLSSFEARSQCDSSKLRIYIDDNGDLLVKDKLVIDARVDEINSFRGKTSFKNQAEIAVTNMNPFRFKYKILVEQEEIKDEAFLDFLKLLGAPVSDIIGAQSAIRQNEVESLPTGGNLDILIERTAHPPMLSGQECSGGGDKAIAELESVRDIVLKQKTKVDHEVKKRSLEYSTARGAYNDQKGNIFSASIEAIPLCDSANSLHNRLTTSNYPTVRIMENLLGDIKALQSLTDELRNTATAFKSEYGNCQARSKGLSYANSLIRLADELDKLSAGYETKVTALKNETENYDSLVNFIDMLEGKEAKLLQRELTVYGQYEISALQIKVVPEPLTSKDATDQDAPVIGDTQAARRSANTSDAHNGSRARVFASSDAAAFTDTNGGSSGDEDAGQKSDKKEITAKATIGARRFELSGGLAISSLERREFKPVLGFARNAEGQVVDDDGNPTDKREFSQTVGLTEDSRRRIAPIVLLHTRLTNNPRYNLFLSFGLTGKNNGGNFDLEYLVGPSFNYKNMFFTFGGYVGKQQRLAGDLFLGAKLPDGSDDVPVVNEYRWKPGFSFTYRIPVGDGPKNPN